MSGDGEDDGDGRPGASAPGLAEPPPGRGVAGHRLSRRTFLELVGAGAAVTLLPVGPGCGSGGSTDGATGAVARFFTAEERDTIEALAAAILPDDETVGALGAGAVEYVDRWLAAFAHPRPDVFRGGPFSGRWPYPDPRTGDPGTRYPENGFHRVLPLSRLQELAFRIELEGSEAVPEANVNAGVLPPVRGLRPLYREAAAQLAAYAADRGVARFGDLSEEERLAAFRETPGEFRDRFVGHLCEGMFGDPVYGGNRDGGAWREYFYDGDSQPLGHTLFDPATGAARDRPDQPNQTLDPRLPNEGLGDADIERFVTLIALFQDGQRFF